MSSAVYQAVGSPYRKALDAHERLAVRIGHSRPTEVLVRALARAAGVEDPDLRWRFAGGPYFDNQIATLSLEGREASLTISKTVRDEAGPATGDRLRATDSPTLARRALVTGATGFIGSRLAAAPRTMAGRSAVWSETARGPAPWPTAASSCAR